jgi:hypothetical protein
MVVYKIFIKNETGQLTSFIACNKFMLIYKKGVVTHPDTGFLFAFETLEHAKVFIKGTSCYGIEIWKCETEDVSRLLDTHITYNQLKWKKYWKDSDSIYDSTVLYTVPCGTVICKSIKPIEKC